MKIKLNGTPEHSEYSSKRQRDGKYETKSDNKHKMRRSKIIGTRRKLGKEREETIVKELLVENFP